MGISRIAATQRNLPCPVLQLGESAGQGKGSAADLRASLVGRILPHPTDRHADEHGGERCRDHDHDQHDGIGTTVPTMGAVARHLPEHGIFQAGETQSSMHNRMDGNTKGSPIQGCPILSSCSIISITPEPGAATSGPSRPLTRAIAGLSSNRYWQTKCCCQTERSARAARQSKFSARSPR